MFMYHILIQISLKFVLRDTISNMSALAKVMGCGWTSTKPLPEAMMTQAANELILLLIYSAYNDDPSFVCLIFYKHNWWKYTSGAG